MKKYLIFIYLAVFFCATLAAQNENPPVAPATTTTTTTTTTSAAQPKNEKLVSKKGIYILPEQGEFAIGVDAAPFLSYLGSINNRNGQGSPAVNYGNGFGTTNAVYGKYMLDDNKAVRVRLGFTDTKNTKLYPVRQSSLTPDEAAPQYVNDQVANLNKSFYLAVGLEKHRGKSRIQGIYGAELFLGASRYDIDYLYGNSMNNDFTNPATYNDANSYNAQGLRLVKDNQSNSIFAGVRGFVGVEYFIAPKLSLGGEFGYSFIAQRNGIEQFTYEYWDGPSSSVKKVVTKAGNNSYKLIGLQTDNLSASINILFYF